MGYILYDINKQYKPAASTNITITWRKTGWIPPSEHPWYRDKWTAYKTLAMRNEEKEEKEEKE